MGIFEIMRSINVKQVIFQGPPGTSKTHGAKELIKSRIEEKNSDVTLDECKLKVEDYKSGSSLENDVYWDMVQFHPSYSYEDFVRGITVSTENDTVNYKTVNKIFGAICELAGRKENQGKDFFLIIDEINRADVATVFGELIYALEYRGEKNQIATPYMINNNRNIYVPENLYIIGTMNTADKSVGVIDMAIRRRFLFVDKLPDKSVIEQYFAKRTNQEKLRDEILKCFKQVQDIVKKSIRGNYKAKDFEIGHTYFLPNSEKVEEARKSIQYKLQYQVLPMLREYAENRIIDTNKDILSGNLKKYLEGDDSVIEAVVKDLLPVPDGEKDE